MARRVLSHEGWDMGAAALIANVNIVFGESDVWPCCGADLD